MKTYLFLYGNVQKLLMILAEKYLFLFMQTQHLEAQVSEDLKLICFDQEKLKMLLKSLNVKTKLLHWKSFIINMKSFLMINSFYIPWLKAHL